MGLFIIADNGVSNIVDNLTPNVVEEIITNVGCFTTNYLNKIYFLVKALVNPFAGGGCGCDFLFY
jgi:hypothetical protein